MARLAHTKQQISQPQDNKPGQTGRLQGQVALVSGAESATGRAVALALAEEGAEVVVLCSESPAAAELREHIERHGGHCLSLAGASGDLSGDESMYRQTIQHAVNAYGLPDIVVNNAAVRWCGEATAEVDPEQMGLALREGIYSLFQLTRAALPFVRGINAVINTLSVTVPNEGPAFGEWLSAENALDQLTTLTRSFAETGPHLDSQGLRAAGEFGGWATQPQTQANDDPLGDSMYDSQCDLHGGRARPAEQPEQVALSYVFSVSKDASSMAGFRVQPGAQSSRE